jgi:hypothetical protein
MIVTRTTRQSHPTPPTKAYHGKAVFVAAPLHICGRPSQWKFPTLTQCEMRVLTRCPSAATIPRAQFRTFMRQGPFGTSWRPCCTQAWDVLGLPPNTPRKDVKARFYELAKQTHPDTMTCSSEPDAEGTSAFVEVLAAFELLMQQPTSPDGTISTTTAPSAAARGTGGSRRKSQPARATAKAAAPPSLGEILCDRLNEEPSAVPEVWDEIVAEQVEVRTSMMEAIFRACGSRGGGGLSQALEILRDAQRRGLLGVSAPKEAAAISIIKWCKEDSSSFARIMSELEESERTPEVRETLAYANALYSGYSDGYSA